MKHWPGNVLTWLKPTRSTRRNAGAVQMALDKTPLDAVITAVTIDYYSPSNGGQEMPQAERRSWLPTETVRDADRIEDMRMANERHNTWMGPGELEAQQHIKEWNKKHYVASKEEVWPGLDECVTTRYQAADPECPNGKMVTVPIDCSVGDLFERISSMQDAEKELKEAQAKIAKLEEQLAKRKDVWEECWRIEHELWMTATLERDDARKELEAAKYAIGVVESTRCDQMIERDAALAKCTESDKQLLISDGIWEKCWKVEHDLLELARTELIDANERKHGLRTMLEISNRDRDEARNVACKLLQERNYWKAQVDRQTKPRRVISRVDMT